MSKTYNVRVSVGLSQLVEVEASSEIEAEAIATEMFQTGEVFDDIIGHEYYDGLIGADVESEVE